MKDYSVKPIHVDLRPSPMLATGLLASSLGACVVLASLPLPVAMIMAGCALVLLACMHATLQHAWHRLPGSLSRIEVTARGDLRCQDRRGAWYTATVLGSSFVTPWLTVLNLRLQDRHLARHVVLLPDMLDAEAFRHLRVWLRWASPPAAGN